MADLVKAYSALKPGVVALAWRYDTGQTDQFPDIIGTGFIVRSDGLVITNHHVMEAVRDRAREEGKLGPPFPICALLFWPDNSGESVDGMSVIHLEIESVAIIRTCQFDPPHYGDLKPDVALLRVRGRDLPSLELCPEIPNEGEPIATAGFPLGTGALVASGWLEQLGPTLHRGVVSAVLPFPCARPHAFKIDVMTLGGASGSPVFRPDSGEVLGVLFAGLVYPVGDQRAMAATSVALVVPSYLIEAVILTADDEGKVKAVANAPTLAELVDAARESQTPFTPEIQLGSTGSISDSTIGHESHPGAAEGQRGT